MAAIAADKAARELANKEWLEGLTRQRDELLGGVDSPGRAYLMDGHTPENDAEEDEVYEVYTTATKLFARTVQWDTKVDGASALALELWGYRVKAAQLFPHYDVGERGLSARPGAGHQ